MFGHKMSKALLGPVYLEIGQILVGQRSQSNVDECLTSIKDGDNLV